MQTADEKNAEGTVQIDEQHHNRGDVAHPGEDTDEKQSEDQKQPEGDAVALGSGAIHLVAHLWDASTRDLHLQCRELITLLGVSLAMQGAREEEKTEGDSSEESGA